VTVVDVVVFLGQNSYYCTFCAILVCSRSSFFLQYSLSSRLLARKRDSQANGHIFLPYKFYGTEGPLLLVRVPGTRIFLSSSGKGGTSIHTVEFVRQKYVGAREF
jgi:hypothetical protein